MNDLEQCRLATLTEYHIAKLHDNPGKLFDNITSLAAQLFKVPFACISIIDSDKVLILSGSGVDERTIDKEPGLCVDAIKHDYTYQIPDTRNDPFCVSNSIVAKGIRFYAGSQLKTPKGFNIGTLCIMDTKIRNLNKEEIGILENLCQIAMHEIEKHKTNVEHKKTQDKLELSEGRYRSLIHDVLDFSNVGVFILDHNFEIAWINKTLESYFGISRGEVIGLNKRTLIENEIKNIFEFPDKFSDKILATYSNNTYVEHFECHILENDVCCERWLEHWSQPIKSGLYTGGRIEYYTDISERRKMKSELLRIQKFESLSTISSGIAHDFNNYLQGIYGNLSIAKTMVDNTDEIFEILSNAEEITSHAHHLTQQLLNFSPKKAQEKEPVSVLKLLENTVIFSLHGSSVLAKLKLPENLWPIEVEKGQFVQIIQNLVINAIQAMPGGGTIHVYAVNVQLSDGDIHGIGISPGKYVKIEIQDEGTGIADEVITNVFDPFFTTKSNGTGLGLATTYSIIKNCNGDIQVRSEENKGAVFTLFFPALNDVRKKTDIIDISTENVTARILVMDDEAYICQFVALSLEEVGVDVETAANGGEAINLYKNAIDCGRPFDVVILDLVIKGGMGGGEVIKELQKLNPDIKAVISSGYTNTPLISNYKNYGFKALITKPYNINELLNRIQKLVK